MLFSLDIFLLSKQLQLSKHFKDCLSAFDLEMTLPVGYSQLMNYSLAGDVCVSVHYNHAWSQVVRLTTERISVAHPYNKMYLTMNTCIMLTLLIFNLYEACTEGIRKEVFLSQSPGQSNVVFFCDWSTIIHYG